MVIDQRAKFIKDFSFDFVEEFILKQNNNYYFYLLGSQQDILDLPFEFVYAYNNISTDSKISFNLLFSKINVKSELCEIMGSKQFYDNLCNDLLSFNNTCEISFPIIHNNCNKQLTINLKYQQNANLFLGQIIQVKNDVLNEMLFEKSYKDTITGLFNRNALNKHINELENDENTYGIMIDLDKFKSINDTYGHQKGDYVLQSVGEKLLGLVNDNRIFYRISGDEFFIQVKNANISEIMEFMSCINHAISEITIGSHNVTCSIGAVKFHSEKFDNNRYIMPLADLALYKAKLNGRNQSYLLNDQEIDNYLNS